MKFQMFGFVLVWVLLIDSFKAVVASGNNLSSHHRMICGRVLRRLAFFPVDHNPVAIQSTCGELVSILGRVTEAWTHPSKRLAENSRCLKGHLRLNSCRSNSGFIGARYVIIHQPAI